LLPGDLVFLMPFDADQKCSARTIRERAVPAQPNNMSGQRAKARGAVSTEEAHANAATETQTHPPDARVPPAPERRRFSWRGLRRWFQENTFAPLWLPKRWRHPIVGYLMGILLVGVAIAVDVLILQFYADFVVPGLLVILAILLTALTWGAGPGFAATLVGELLFDYFATPPPFTFYQQGAAWPIDDFLLMLIGAVITLIALQVQRARRNAEALAAALAEERAHSELERQRLQAVLDVLPVGVGIADAQGRGLEVNRAFKELWGKEVLPANVAGYAVYKGWWPGSGQLIAAEEWALARALRRGEVCPGEEVEIETFDGQRKAAINTAAPIRNEDGAIVGGVVAMVDITERKAAEQERLRLLEREQAARAEAEQATERLRTIQFISDAALAHPGLDDLLNTLLARVCEALGIDNCSILLLDEAGQTLTVRAVRGLEAKQAHEVRIPLGKGAAGRIAATREPLIIDDLSQFETVYPSFRERFRSFVGVPLLVDGRVLGVMHMTSVLPGRFTQDDARLLGLLASRIALGIDRARLYEAERHAHAEADARASQIEAIFEALADGLVAYDAQGYIQRANTVARRLMGLDGAYPDYGRRSLSERRDLLLMRDEQGQLIPEEQLPVRRALHGESLTGEHATEMIMRRADGRDVMVHASSTPVRDAQGQIVGVVSIFSDVTERRRLERRTHEALAGLLAMAETLVQAPDEPAPADRQTATPNPTAQRLAELGVHVLGCQRLGMLSIDPAAGELRPIAVVGLSPELEQFWWAEEFPLHPRDDPRWKLVERLLEGKSLIWDMTQPPLREEPNPYGIRTFLAVPMRLREQLVGALFLDYGGEDHTFTAPERSLAEGVAMLAALVMERERLLREREEARGSALALREANRQMDAFLGVASHELRTPLTSVLLGLQLSQRRYQQLLQEEGDITEPLRQRLEFLLSQQVRTEYQARRLDRLVNDLLDVSRIQADKLVMHPKLAELAAVVAEAVEEQRQAAPERVIHLHLPPGERVLLSMDADRIGQVVTNYLTNALKYSAEECPVEVGLELETGAARVWVRDQGPGLPPEEQERIWGRFHRVPDVEVQSGSGVGLGLGLYISRVIIEAHQGEVGLQTAPGAGATFWFRLPLPSS
jgi:PAS domain S-box-containing protein